MTSLNGEYENQCAPIGQNDLYIADHWYFQEAKGEEESQRNQEKESACQSERSVQAIPVWQSKATA